MEIHLKACAKINLTLDVVGIRPDGYHLLDMIMQSVSLYDEVSVKLNHTGSINVVSSDKVLGGEEDIAYKAAVAFLTYVNSNSGADITITKNIPTAAGLGGGSADAAAVLYGLNYLHEGVLSQAVLEAIALSLGADVPYFLNGGTVLVGGIGEIFEKLPDMPECFIVIAKNAQKKSTKEMYRIIDGLGKSDFRPDNMAAKQAIIKGDLNLLCENIGNVFLSAWPHNSIVDIMSDFNPLAVSLSGSGPSYFSIFTSCDQAEACLHELNNRGIKAFLTVPTKLAIIH